MQEQRARGGGRLTDPSRFWPRGGPRPRALPSQLLDKRNAEVRGKLSSIGDNSAEIEQLQTDAEAVIAGARNEVAAAMAAQKAATSAEIEKELEETRAKFERELKTAMAALAKEEAELMAQSEESVGDLSKAIVAKVLA